MFAYIWVFLLRDIEKLPNLAEGFLAEIGVEAKSLILKFGEHATPLWRSDDLTYEDLMRASSAVAFIETASREERMRDSSQHRLPY